VFDGSVFDTTSLPAVDFNSQRRASFALRRWWGPSLGLAIICAALTAIAVFSSLQWEWDVEKHGEVQTVTVMDIHARDNFINPSVVDVNIPTDSGWLGVRTDDESRYRVGQSVRLRYDPTKLDHAAFVGDSNGPTWTLGTGYSAMIGCLVFGVAGMVVFIVDWSERRSQVRNVDHAIQAMLAALFAGQPITRHVPSMPVPTQVEDSITRRRARAVRGMAIASVPLIALVIMALRGYQISELVLRIAAWLCGIPLFSNALRYAQTRTLVTALRQRIWTPAILIGRVPNKQRSTWPTYGEFLLATDAQHAAAYRSTSWDGLVTGPRGPGPENVWFVRHRLGTAVLWPNGLIAYSQRIKNWEHKPAEYEGVPANRSEVTAFRDEP